MNFYIRRNSILPNLKMKLIFDGRNDYKRFHDLLENSVVTFSMKNVNNGVYKVANKEGNIVKIINNDIEEYYVEYQWIVDDTNELGQFEGEFKIKFLDDCSHILVPIKEKLYINVLTSFTKGDIEQNNNLIDSDGCLIYCQEYQFTGGTVSGATEFLSGVTINGNLDLCNGELNVETINGCSPVTIQNNLIIEENSLSGKTAYFDEIYSGNTNLIYLINDIANQYSANTFTTGSTFDSNAKIATFNRNDGNNYTLDLSTLSTVDTYVTGFTYNDNNLSIKRNENLPDLNVTINTFTGLTINGNTNLNGTIISQPLSGSTSRFVEVNNLGEFSATKDIIEGFLTNGSPQSLLLEDNNNWDNNDIYIGTTITDTFQGQKYYNNDYLFVAVNDNDWIRVRRKDLDLLSGVTFNSNTRILELNRKNNTNLNVLITDQKVTGFTYDNQNTFTIQQNEGQPDLNITINDLSINSLSANTISGDTIFSGGTLLQTIIENIVTSTSPVYIRRHDFTGNTITSTSYCGTAPDGSLENQPLWDITKIDIPLSGSGITSTYANGVTWAGRYTHIYV